MIRLGRVAIVFAAAACVHGQPAIDGATPVPTSPSTTWSPSSSVISAAAHDRVIPPPAATTTLGSQVNLSQLTLGDVVDLALRNSPATRISYTQALAAADVYGSTQSRFFPTVGVGVGAAQALTLSSPGRPPVEHWQFGPSVTLSYTVLDFGGRSGSIDVARQTAIAADLTHNSTVENTILQVEGAAFSYLSNRSERDAQRIAVDLAKAALDEANERHRVGLATIADVLQAQTAASEAQLQLETLEGSVQIARGALAVAMGLAANAPVDIPEVAAADSAHFITQSVDTLIELAVRNRPELATVRAQSAAASSQIRVARSGYMPSLTFGGTGGNNASDISTFAGKTYSLNVGVQMPVFTGFSNQYDIASANEQYRSALARAEDTKQQIIQQVFTAYYTLRTSTDRVRTSADLLASATESETVARERYREGVGTIVDLLVAQSALATARAQSVDARWQWRTSLAQLAHDIGVLNARGDTSFAPLTPVPDVKPGR
ncbi:MAG TPA: TolC family protein [Gemmatimonadaceae bacterium]|nr:TolC family protein [Gemmatimonadaceae bacterium]